MSTLPHLNQAGEAHMVDVSAKEATFRRAVARGMVRMGEAAIQLLQQNALPKGDALAVARIAGIMAAKKTADLLPLCHPLSLSHVELRLSITGQGVEVEAEAAVQGATGIEMEVLTAVSIAGLALYDMIKSVDRNACITDIRLIEKAGGRSGHYVRSEVSNAEKQS